MDRQKSAATAVVAMTVTTSAIAAGMPAGNADRTLLGTPILSRRA